MYNTNKNDLGQSGVFPFWKNPGETLAIMLRRFREEHGLSETDKLTYAGRLDPMAEGIVPVLVGEARFQKDRLLGRSKTYEVDILLGLSTDTADMLGLATPNPTLSPVKGGELISSDSIKQTLETLSKTTELSYPNYSSRPVDGKPLFMHARAGNKVTLPVKKITIHSMELLSVKEVALTELLGNAIEVIKKVHGDFRQSEIIAQWQEMQKADGDPAFANPSSRKATNGQGATADKAITMQVITIRATVSSGTYMRSLAERLGELLGIPALAYRIVRTAVEET